MAGPHVSRELLRAVARGELPPKVLVDLVFRHVMEECPHCRLEYDAFRRTRIVAEDYSVPLQKAFSQLSEKRETVLQQRAEAELWLAELRLLEPAPRKRKVQRARNRYRGRVFAERLIAASIDALPGAPRESLSWAECAYAVLYKGRVPQEDAACAVRALAWMANAHRALGELPRAEELVGMARDWLSRWGAEQGPALADLDRVEGALRKDCQRLEEAEQLLSKAALQYQVLGDEVSLAACLLTLGIVYNRAGDAVAAVDATRRALEKIDRQEQPKLYIFGRYNLAFYLLGQGQLDAAAAVLESDAEVFAGVTDDYMGPRFKLLRAKLAAERGDFRSSEAGLVAARDQFARVGIGYDVANVNLELALLYLRQGKLELVKSTVADAVLLFESQMVHRNALAALILMREAAFAEELTAAMIHSAQSFLLKVFSAGPHAHDAGGLPF